MAVLWECRLNLAICHANDFMIKLIKTHDASSSPRLIRIGSFFSRGESEGKGLGSGWVDKAKGYTCGYDHRLDYQPLFEKAALTPSPRTLSSRGGEQSAGLE